MENDQLYIFRISVDVRNFRALRRLPLPVASIFVKATFPAEVVQVALESTSKQAGKQLLFNSGQTIFIVPLSHQKAESRQRSEQYQERSGKKVAPPLIISPQVELQVFCLNPYAGALFFTVEMMHKLQLLCKISSPAYSCP
jgi:hypothetical protein